MEASSKKASWLIVPAFSVFTAIDEATPLPVPDLAKVAGAELALELDLVAGDLPILGRVPGEVGEDGSESRCGEEKLAAEAVRRRRVVGHQIRQLRKGPSRRDEVSAIVEALDLVVLDRVIARRICVSDGECVLAGVSLPLP